METLGTRLGNYVIDELIGVGGMAEVFLGHAVSGPLKGRSVAIKQLRPSAATDLEVVDRFLGEADLARMVTHPALVEVYEVGTTEAGHYLVMEYVDGRDLRQLLLACNERKIRLPVTLVTHIVARVLEAADALHNAVSPDGTPLKVAHCDLTPSNVFISRDGEIKVGDLGVARVGAMEGDVSGVTMGKIGYLSPEQVDAAVVDRRTDIFASGVMLFELLTGTLPFKATDLETARRAFRAGAPNIQSLRPDVSAELASVISRAITIEPDKRFFDARAFLNALAPHRDTAVAGDLAVAAVVRGLFPY